MRFVGEGADKVRHKVGWGPLVGKVEVDQVYARYQHERLDLKHPRGGYPKYLWLALSVRKDQYLQTLATSVLEQGPARGMRGVVEQIDRALHQFAPVDESNLRNSGHPTVTDNGELVYDRAPRQPRMSEEQLRANRRARRRGRGGHSAGGLGDVT
jgi:hypothetical protein